jgi:undecaprenyl-diphosphatase
VVAEKLIQQVDRSAEELADRVRKVPGADRVFYTASALGDFGLLWVIFALLRALRGGKDNERAALRGVAATGIESFLVNVLLKSVFKRQRPLEQVDHPLPLRQPLTSSFPSGHATAAFCGAVILSEGDKLAPLYFGAAAVIAASRIYVKIHHASDVIGGVVVGVALGEIAKRIVPLHRPRRS